MKGEIFHAKIMLFGEYSVIFDSMGLTVPYSHFTGKLSFISIQKGSDDETARESNRHLQNFFTFLRGKKRGNPANLPIDLEAFQKDLSDGLYFESNIPQGYGIGSSGALVAAIYDQYAFSKVMAGKILAGPDISELKDIFSGMESYFHGRSSGIDPLLCYIRHPLLIKNKNEIETVGIPWDKFGSNQAIFLIDTGITGQTGPLVNLFLEKSQDDDYLLQIRESMIPTVNGCISNLLEGKMDSFFNNLEVLSDFQYKYLLEMIPDHMRTFWLDGLKRDDFKMKLCGSGGGGFLLGISRDFLMTREYFHRNGLKLVPVDQNNMKG